MKKQFLTFLLIFLAFPMLNANKIYYTIMQTQLDDLIRYELQSLINASDINDIIVITGSKTNARQVLDLTFSTEITLLWEATYQSTTPFSGSALIYLFGQGIFEVANGTIITSNVDAIYCKDNCNIIVSGSGRVETSGDHVHAIFTHGNVEVRDNAFVSGTTGEVIETRGENSIITVSGGTVSAISENAIIARGSNAKVYVSGGTVSNDSDNIYPVIYLDNYFNSDLNVYISGTGKVEAKNMGRAIATFGGAIISDDAQVSSRGNSDAILASTSATVKDHAKITAFYGRTISSSNVTVSGGLVFAYGTEVLDVITSPVSGMTGTGVLIAWNKDANNTIYEMYSAVDLLIEPEPATAYWAQNGTKYGIFYANGENTGFIPLDVSVVVSVKEPDLSNLKLYPNPTTGVLNLIQERIRNYELGTAAQIGASSAKLINNVEIYDICGRKQIFDILYPTSEIEKSDIKINISHLQPGIYFVKLGERMEKVVKL